jgi:hypothetical protein
MSQEVRQTEVREKTQQLLQGPLKHIRAAALAAALLPLASVMATPASAQSIGCPSGGICGFVFNDANNNGIQDAGETGIEGAKVSAVVGGTLVEVESGPDGFYNLTVGEPGSYPVAVQIPVGTQPSPANAGFDDAKDSDGVSDTLGYSVTQVDFVGFANSVTGFGFYTPPTKQPGTGTPGYWKNHAEAWPVAGIWVGGIYYTKAQAIAWLGKVGKDKSTTMFSSLVPAMLNVLIGNSSLCVASTITAANLWMTAHPVGSNVAASSDAWTIGEPMHQQMDAYNNGQLCAPHRN